MSCRSPITQKLKMIPVMLCKHCLFTILTLLESPFWLRNAFRAAKTWLSGQTRLTGLPGQFFLSPLPEVMQDIACMPITTTHQVSLSMGSCWWHRSICGTVTYGKFFLSVYVCISTLPCIHKLMCATLSNNEHKMPCLPQTKDKLQPVATFLHKLLHSLEISTARKRERERQREECV